MDEASSNLRNSHEVDGRYYRFGVCGLSSGGKTCILAALALPRVAHPLGLTATLLPLPKDAEQHLKDGWLWVDKARTALLEDRVPPPNPHTGRLTLRYKFTDGHQREAFVELVDYSGELLDSRLSQSLLAEQLRRYFDEVDGFVFIAEHPRPGEKTGELAGYLLHLKEALALQREEARGRSFESPAPIALLVNKWDRSGTLAHTPDAHALESRRLDEFLATEPPPPHTGLLAELRAASRARCCTFPVSAFGEAVRIPGERPGEFIEKPACVAPELPSFGLEEPFLWLVEQCDRRDVDELDAATQKRHLWWNTLDAIRCLKNAGRIKARISPTSPETPRVSTVQRRLGWHFTAQLALLAALCFGADLLWDVIGLRRARTAMTNPSDANGWFHAESWFTSYTESFPLRHLLHRTFFLSNADAANELQSARSQRDEAFWIRVVASADESARVALCHDYLKTFPQGAHSPDALQLLAEAETRQRRERLKAQLQALADRFESISHEANQAARNATPNLKPAADKLQQLLRDAQNLPDIAVADADSAKQWQSIIANGGALDARIAGQVAAGQLRKTYYDFIARKEWENAGSHLAGLPANDFKDLHDHFRLNVIPQVEARARSIMGNGADWQKALASLAGFQSAQLRSLLPQDGIPRLSALEEQIKEAGDRWLYAQCNSSSGPAPFQVYISNGPLKTMSSVAERWLHFLNLREQPNTFRVGVTSILWGSGARSVDNGWDTQNKLSITVGNALPRETDFWSDRMSIWTPNPRDHAVEVRDAIARNPQNVNLRVWDVDWPDGDDYLGGIKGSWLLEDLDGLVRDLTDSEFGPNTVTFCVEVLDRGEWYRFRKPTLPSWSPPQ